MLVVPGEVFSMTKYIRIGYGYDPRKTLKGLERVGKVLETI